MDQLMYCSGRTIPYTSISGMPSAASSPTTASSGCSSGDDMSNSSFIPSTLPSSQLMVKPGATLEDLSNMIAKCTEMVLNCDQCSEERKWLVRYLVELRYRVQELKDAGDSPPATFGVTILGHHFKSLTSLNTNVKQYCDHCSGVIWSVVQGSYICEDCNFICHWKCVSHVVRVCAHVIATEEGLKTNLSVQRGLAAQHYKCAECKIDLIFKGKWSEPRLCDYSGQFYCATCHWNDVTEIPGRVIHNWDWEKRPVCRSAYQLLAITRSRPLINLQEANSKLFSFVVELDYIRQLRRDLRHMRRYLVACSEGGPLLSGELVHLVEGTELYSLEDLEKVWDKALTTQLGCLAEKCREHITKCQVCYGKGYLCELCGNDDVIFPFDSGSVGCDKCNSLFHRACWIRKNKVCMKCIRIQKRFTQLKDEKDDDCDNFNDDDWMLQ